MRHSRRIGGRNKREKAAKTAMFTIQVNIAIPTGSPLPAGRGAGGEEPRMWYKAISHNPPDGAAAAGVTGGQARGECRALVRDPRPGAHGRRPGLRCG